MEDNKHTIGLEITNHRFVAAFLGMIGTAVFGVGVEGLAHSEYKNGSGLVIISVLLFSIGFFWSYIASKLPNKLSQTATAAALDFRWWLLVLLLVIGYLAGPSVLTGNRQAQAVPDPRLDGFSARISGLESQQQTLLKDVDGLHSSFETIQALEKAYWLEKELSKSERLSSQYDTETQRRLNLFRTGTDEQRRLILSGRIMMEPTSVEGIEKQLTVMAKADLGLDLNLGQHPDFERNHNYPAPGADDIQDKFFAEEFRRLYDQYETSKTSITDLIAQYRQAEGHYEGIVSDAARSK